MASVNVVAPLPTDDEGPRMVRVKKGAQPTHSTLNPLQRWAWRTFRDRVTKLTPDPALEENLVKAHMRIRADEYMAYVYGMTIIIGSALVVAGIVLGVILISSGAFLFGILLAPVVPIFGTLAVFFILPSMPGSAAKARGKQIDSKIGPSMSFVSAMASADVNVDQIFKELARQKVYGQIAEEAAWITRDTELLGVDILTALRTGAARTPSKRFQDFLQGVVTTATSGGQLKPYFLSKAEQYERENKLDRQKRVETMGLMAETFVTVVVAFPLFLVIIIAIFAIIGGGGAFMLNVLWGIVLGMIPLSQFAFIFFMYQLAQEL
ncbi:MAG TPA: type II secretion system F family protein [Thermoplasmata archaeon]|nr:type II secretion system F family protein [Thermoplasmata archaeon]